MCWCGWWRRNTHFVSFVSLRSMTTILIKAFVWKDSSQTLASILFRQIFWIPHLGAQDLGSPWRSIQCYLWNILFSKVKAGFCDLVQKHLKNLPFGQKISGQESAFHKAQYWTHLVERLEDGQWPRPSFLLGSPHPQSQAPPPSTMSLVTNIEGCGQECDGMCSRHHHIHCHPPAGDHTLLF